MDPLAKKLGDKAAQAVRQQVKDISEEVKEIPKSGKAQLTGKDEDRIEESQISKDDNTQNAKQQLLTLLRGTKKQTSTPQNKASSNNNSQATQNDDSSKLPRYEQLDRDIEKARREREEKEQRREAMIDQEMQTQEASEKQPFVAPKGRKPRGMQNPMARKGEKKNELGRTAKG